VLERLAETPTIDLVPVPSSIGGRPSWQGVHPLVTVCERMLGGSQASVEVKSLLTPGPEPPSRLTPSRSGYVIAPGQSVAGRRIVLVDDMFTSGARALSAAHTLATAGAQVLGIVPFGRVVRPEHNGATAAFWDDHRATPAGPQWCAICHAPPAGCPATSAKSCCSARVLVTMRVVA
jgi:hypothetical protein